MKAEAVPQAARRPTPRPKGKAVPNAGAKHPPAPTNQRHPAASPPQATRSDPTRTRSAIASLPTLPRLRPIPFRKTPQSSASKPLFFQDHPPRPAHQAPASHQRTTTKTHDRSKKNRSPRQVPDTAKSQKNQRGRKARWERKPRWVWIYQEAGDWQGTPRKALEPAEPSASTW